jgi:hypothetical protein
MFRVPSCDVRYDLRIKTMLCSSLPPFVCRRVHVLPTLLVFVGVYLCPTHVVLCLLVYSCVRHMLCCVFCAKLCPTHVVLYVLCKVVPDTCCVVFFVDSCVRHMLCFVCWFIVVSDTCCVVFFVHSCVRHMLCCVFTLFFFVLCCQFLCIINFLLHLRCSRMFLFSTS